MKLTEKSKSIIHHVLLYGPPKSGKTRLAGTLAEKYKLLWFDLENGYETLTQLPTTFQENIDIISLPDTKSFPIAIETCLHVIKGQKQRICQAHGKISCALCMQQKLPLQEVCMNDLGPDWIVVFDSASQLTDSAIAHITKNQLDDYKLQTDDWGNLGKLMKIFYSHVQNSGCHIVVISHDIDIEKDDKLPERIVPSAGSRNFARNVAKYFGDVIYCGVKNGRHIAASSTTFRDGVLTGSRSGVTMEKNKVLSLLDIFDPNRAPTAPVNEDVNGSMSALERLRNKLNA